MDRLAQLENERKELMDEQDQGQKKNVQPTITNFAAQSKILHQK